ncbi:MAG: hypothetical protein Q4D89_06800 [Arachnia propionica]|uniref:hypothetical protein n=1 Tax=Arachnia propionica TaxID=1750 RepID=UPI00270C2B5D|nr:hypothetical protein [Arachnia propionica]
MLVPERLELALHRGDGGLGRVAEVEHLREMAHPVLPGGADVVVALRGRDDGCDGLQFVVALAEVEAGEHDEVGFGLRDLLVGDAVEGGEVDGALDGVGEGVDHPGLVGHVGGGEGGGDAEQ